MWSFMDIPKHVPLDKYKDIDPYFIGGTKGEILKLFPALKDVYKWDVEIRKGYSRYNGDQWDGFMFKCRCCSNITRTRNWGNNCVTFVRKSKLHRFLNFPAHKELKKVFDIVSKEAPLQWYFGHRQGCHVLTTFPSPYYWLEAYKKDGNKNYVPTYNYYPN